MAKERARLTAVPTSYFVGTKPTLQFVPSGCKLLDCACSGGAPGAYPLGRMVNIVGDKSTAKTALAVEAVINFMLRFPGAKPKYRECEAAFEKAYASAMGLDADNVDFGDGPINTVEEFAKDFDTYLNHCIKADEPGIYVLDSLDSLTDEAEMERGFGEATYGTAKAKLLSAFFRTYARKIEESKVLLVVISQVRDNIGVMFGEKHTRSGGHAMDFYASLVIWLAKIETIKKTKAKVERAVGVTIRANVKKNKVALPFRTCDFDFIFGYGVEDLGASVKWLHKIGRLKDADIAADDYKEYIASLETMSNEEYRKEQANIAQVITRVWQEVETTFLPRRSKYGNT